MIKYVCDKCGFESEVELEKAEFGCYLYDLCDKCNKEYSIILQTQSDERKTWLTNKRCKNTDRCKNYKL